MGNFAKFIDVQFGRISWEGIIAYEYVVELGNGKIIAEPQFLINGHINQTMAKGIAILTFMTSIFQDYGGFI